MSKRMLNYLISLNLLPQELTNNYQPEIILNKLGDPYQLRCNALDEKIKPFELGRVLLHLVQRRGFLSNRKTLLGDMIDDPDAMALFNEETDDTTNLEDKEETAFKKDIAVLRDRIKQEKCRTLGEYLSKLPKGQVKRNRIREGGNLRTYRQMYKDKFWTIINKQLPYHPVLQDTQESKMVYKCNQPRLICKSQHNHSLM